MSFDELYEFKANTLGGIDIKGFKQKNDPAVTDISISPEHNGVPVTELSHEAFGDAVYLRSVCVPGSVQWIWGCCFARCSSLERIELPESIKLIGAWAFSGCSSLKEITLPKSVQVIEGTAFEN